MIFLQLFNSASVGYNMGVLIEACEICLTEETQHIRRGAYTSLGLMAFAVVLDFCLTSPSRRANPVNRFLTSKLNLPPSMLISLPMFVINLIIFGYIAGIHGKYHTLFDSVPVLLPTLVGIAVAVVLMLSSPVRMWCVDKRGVITRPEALLDEFPGNISSKVLWATVKNKTVVRNNEEVALELPVIQPNAPLYGTFFKDPENTKSFSLITKPESSSKENDDTSISLSATEI